MMHRIASTSAVALGALALGVGVVSMPTAVAGKPVRSVVMWASPAEVTASELPCRSTAIDVTLTNTGTEPVFADVVLGVEEPLGLSDTLFSTYLPASDPVQSVTKSFDVSVPRGTPEGTYEVTVTGGRSLGRPKQVVPVTVEPVPSRAPGANLAYGEQAIASSTHGSFGVCGAVDGDKDQGNWNPGGWNDATSGVFPDWYGVEWPSVQTIDRVELWTKTPVLTSGIQDFDVQVRDGDVWRTVAQVVGNTEEHVVAAFPAAQTDAVRVLVHLGRGNYSRLMEFEVYGPR